jgi:hypothetical protein
MTSINWFTGTTMTTAEIYDAYGFNTMTPCGMTVQDVVWEVITKGYFNPCINGVPVWGLPLTLVTDEQTPAPAPAVESAPVAAPAVESAPVAAPAVEPAPVAAPAVEPAPAVESAVEPAPAVESAVEPAPAVESALTRRDLDEESELVSTINRACYMHGACTRGLPAYDEYVDEMFASWSMVLNDAAGELTLYLEHTAFRSNSDKAARRTLQAVLDKAVRKLNKHGID